MTNENHSGTNIPKLALTRTEAAQALGIRPVTLDRLTFKKDKMADCRRYRMFFALLRNQAGNFGIHFKT